MGEQNTTKVLIPSAVGRDYSPWVAGASPLESPSCTATRTNSACLTELKICGKALIVSQVPPRWLKKGNPVQIRDGPAAVTGTNVARMSLFTL